MLLYDTLSRKKREFRPLRGNTARIYTCGPSVYEYSHIGNFRTYLFEDILVRYLEYKGYGVKRVMNITDVEDKAVEKANQKGITFRDLSRDKCRSFFRDFRMLGMEMPDEVVPVSEHIPLTIRLIEKICGKGYCRKDKDGIYFDVRKSRGYGELSRLHNRRYLGTARKDDYSKEGLWDFRLWKFNTPSDGKAVWEAPFGRGRPGWHIECSAISMHYLGDTFDIHCGGTDNIFPHHENEIAQGRASSGKMPARFWMHAKHLTIGKRKMSKRTGNVLYVRDLVGKGIDPRCLRFYLISERYRNRLDFTMERFKRKVWDCHETTQLMERLRKRRGKEDGGSGEGIALRLIEGFEGAMDDDLDTKKALRVVFRESANARRLLDEGKLSGKGAREALAALVRIDSVLRVF